MLETVCCLAIFLGAVFVVAPGIGLSLLGKSMEDGSYSEADKKTARRIGGIAAVVGLVIFFLM